MKGKSIKWYKSAISVYKSRGYPNSNKCMKFKTYTRALKRMTKALAERNASLGALDEKMNEFMGGQVKNSHNSRKPDCLLRKRLFCKYALENGIKSTHISSYIGYSFSGHAAFIRKAFTKGFSTNEKHREYWNRWKEFLNRENDN